MRFVFRNPERESLFKPGDVVRDGKGILLMRVDTKQRSSHYGNRYGYVRLHDGHLTFITSDGESAYFVKVGTTLTVDAEPPRFIRPEFTL